MLIMYKMLQACRHERDEAEQKLAKVTADNDGLVQRLVDMKATEVERMNEVNRTCDEMVGSLSSSVHLKTSCFWSSSAIQCMSPVNACIFGAYYQSIKQLQYC